MAESKDNLATEGLSGQVGNFVFRRRRRDGKVFVSRRPGERETEPTLAQQAVNTKFQLATIYGKTVISDPDTKAEYQARTKGGQSAYNVAVADYFGAPDIEAVDLDSYGGQIGDPIRVKVTDNFGVESVSVRIENGDGTLVEEGNAVVDQTGLYWDYAATVLNDSLSGDKITVTATDRPQNTTSEETVLP